MDRYPYLGTLYYLTSVYLRRIGTLQFYLHVHKNTITQTPIKFLAPLLGEFLFICSVYANINTKYFFGTSDICFALIFYALSFSLLCDKLAGRLGCMR